MALSAPFATSAPIQSAKTHSKLRGFARVQRRHFSKWEIFGICRPARHSFAGYRDGRSEDCCSASRHRAGESFLDFRKLVPGFRTFCSFGLFSRETFHGMV